MQALNCALSLGAPTAVAPPDRSGSVEWVSELPRNLREVIPQFRRIAIMFDAGYSSSVLEASDFSEEHEIYTDYDGCHRHHVKHYSYLSAHFS